MIELQKAYAGCEGPTTVTATETDTDAETAPPQLELAEACTVRTI